MAECPIPVENPVKDLGLFQRIIKNSTKRLGTIWAILILGILALGIGGCIAYRIIGVGDVGMGAVAAFGLVTGPLALLTGVNYRKPEEPKP